MSKKSDQIDYKIILIGNSGVGKTCFFRKLSTGEFFDTNISTIGVEKVSLEVNIINDKNEKKNIQVSLFDTAGQEKFRSLSLQYIKGSDGILLLYDITNRESFENVEMWINSLDDVIDTSKENSNNVIILIGNKIDLIDVKGKTRQVTEEEAKNISEKFNMIWGGEMSIKDDTKEDLTKLIEKYVKYIYDKVGEKANKKQKIDMVGKHTRKKVCCAAKMI